MSRATASAIARRVLTAELLEALFAHTDDPSEVLRVLFARTDPAEVLRAMKCRCKAIARRPPRGCCRGVFAEHANALLADLQGLVDARLIEEAGRGRSTPAQSCPPSTMTPARGKRERSEPKELQP